MQDACASASGWGLSRTVPALALVVFTVWLHYQVKFVRVPAGTGTVQQLGEMKVGQPAPDFTLADLRGAEVSLSAMRGQKTVLLEFWATWCPPCRMVMATLHDMGTELRQQNVEVLNVNQGEERDRVLKHVEEEGYSFHVVLDADRAVSDRYSVHSLPTMFLIDKSGIVRWIHVGHLPQTDELRQVLATVTRE